MLPEAYVHIYTRTCYHLYRRDMNYRVPPETTYENVIIERR